MDDKKAELPFGWIVKQSKTYPDRVYYFNVNSGASSWEFPDLLQHYVSGNTNTTAAPVLTATSLVVDAVSPEKFPVSTTSPQQTSQPSDTHNQFKSSHNKHHDTSACNTRNSYKKSSFERETHHPTESLSGKTLKPHTLSQLKCRRSTQAGDDGKMSKLKRGVLDDKFSGQVKSQHQSCSDNKFSGQAKSQYQRSPDKKFSGQAKTQYQPCLDNKFSGKAKSQYQRSPDNKFSGKAKSQCQYSPDKKFSGQVKSQYQPYSVKKVCQYAGTGIKTVTSVQKDLHNDKKEDSAQVSQSYHHYKKPDCSLGNCLQQKVKSNPQTASKSQQPVTFKSYKPSYTKQNVAKDVSYLDNKKLSPIKYPEKSAGIAKVICSTNKSCAQKNEEYSKSAGKDLRTILNVGKRGRENTKETNSSRNLTDDLQAVKRRKTGIEIQCPNFDKQEEIIDLSDDPQSKIKKKINSQVNKEECSLDTYLYVGEDKRRVVRSCHSRDSVNSLVKKTHATNTETLGKTEPVTNTNTSQCIRKLTPSTRDSNVSRSAPIQHVGQERVPKLPDEGSDFDRNNNAEYKLFIGDKDKLLSIQAWINNLQDRAGSESPSVDSYSQVSLGQVNDSVDSGYVTNTTSKTCSPPEKGWAADVKDADVVSRPVVSMEVDECLVDEKLHGEGVWKLAEREGGAGEDGAVPIGVGGNLPVDEGVALPVEENEQEMMDIDEVLVEVRQHVSGSGNQNASSFVDYTDKFTPMKATSKIITVVVDTNVLISNLALFETLKDYQLPGRDRAKLCLYIPWIVLCELDYMKEKQTGNKPKQKARHAISVLKTLFSGKHPRVKGQTPKEAEEASDNFRSTCNDDNILQACLQCQKNGLCAVLLTNDNNLINKALVSNVSAYTAKDILTGLNEVDKAVFAGKSITIGNVNLPKSDYVKSPAPAIRELEVYQSLNSGDSTCTKGFLSGGKTASVGENVVTLSAAPQQTCLADKILKEEKTSTIETLVDDMYCKMKMVLHEALGKILEVEMQKAYDDIWTDIVYRKPPWDLKAILECWKKHWRAVFGFVFPRYLSANVDSLLANISRCKGITLDVVTDICDDSTEILEKAAFTNMYSSRLWEISKTVTVIRDLCGKIPKMTAANVPNLEHYINSQVDATLNVDSSTGLTNDDTAVHTSQCTASTSVINTQKPHTDTETAHSVPHPHSNIYHSNQTGPIQTFSSQNLQNGPLQTLSSQNSQTGPLNSLPSQNSQTVSEINPAVSSVSCDKTVTNVAESDSSPELMAGEHLSNIWRCIYKYCDEFYRTISTSTDPDVLRNIQPVLKILVSTSLELRKYYAGLLELPVTDLSNREQEFTALSQVCNTFFSRLNVQENVPVGTVTPLQLLTLYSKLSYRETLTQFLSQLDEMLKMMYQCLHKLCPDD